jgi:hypothetical protein
VKGKADKIYREHQGIPAKEKSPHDGWRAVSSSYTGPPMDFDYAEAQAATGDLKATDFVISYKLQEQKKNMHKYFHDQLHGSGEEQKQEYAKLGLH